MKYDTKSAHTKYSPFGLWKGALDMLPLSFAVIPWGILAGSVAINTGLSVMQATWHVSFGVGVQPNW